MAEQSPTNAHEALYNARILSLAGGLNKEDRLAHPDASVQMDSPLCGSRIRVDVTVDSNGLVQAYGQQVRACALGQSSAAIMKAHAVGKNLSELTQIRDALEDMLKRNGPVPQGEWADLAVLEPARGHKSRHASILLPFKAVVKAVQEALNAR